MASALADLGKVVGELKAIEKNVAETLERQDMEVKKFGGTMNQTAATLGKLEQKHDALELELKGIVEKCTERLQQVENMMGRPGFGVEQYAERKSVGARFVESENFKKYLEVQCEGTMERLGLKSIIGSTFTERKALTASEADLRNIFSVQKIQEIFADPRRTTRIRDLFPVIPTNSNSVEWVVETAYDNQAGMWSNASGTKPQSDFTFVDESTTMKTIAHWVPVQRQLLMDVPALEAYINLRLIEGLKEVEDRQILYGDGTGQNLQGIMTTPGIQTYNWSSGKPGDTKIDAIRRAITLSQLAYYAVSGIVLHPTDWEDIELTKSTHGLYVWVNVATGAQPMLWKVPVIATNALNAGDFLTGSFGMNAAIWDRENANIRTTDSHSDFFIRNRLVALCEEQLALTVFRPKAFTKGRFDTAPTS